MKKVLNVFKAIFCRHDYECIVGNQAVYKITLDNPEAKYPSYHQWIFVCKKCGKRKKIIIK